MKKIFMFLIMGIFLISFISFTSALEYDNVREYDQVTREATFYNTFLGIKTSEVGKARLNTPLNVKVTMGYQKVAEFDLWAYEDYNDALKQFTFIDMKKKEKINRNFDIRYLTYENVEVEDYKTECYIDYSNATNETRICNEVLAGTHLENKEKWIKVTPADLKKNERLTIGIFTDVQFKDYVDWIPTIYGVEIKEWATWEQVSPENMTSNTAPAPYVASCINQVLDGECWHLFDGNFGTRVISVIANRLNVSLDLGEAKVVSSAWFRITNDGASMTTFNLYGSTDGASWVFVSSGTLVATNVYQQFNFTEATYRHWKLSGNRASDTYVSLQLMKLEGDQTPPDSPPTITLNSPEDNINYTTSPIQINFSCYGSDDINLTSVGLYINGSLDQLNASGINNTNYTFTKTLTEGNYNWTCEGTDNNSQTTKPTERIFKIHTTQPSLTLGNPTGIIDYHLAGDTLILNWTVEEAGENLTTHITNCSYNYNGITTVINNTVCVEINQTTFTPVVGINNLSFTVTDEFGLINTSSTTWDFKLFEVNQTYNNETTEGSLEIFLANLRLGSGISITDAVLFNYNGSSSIGQSFTLGLDTILRNPNFLIPNVAADENITFYWAVTLSDSTELNLSTQNQTIYNLILDNCSSGTNELLNFTVVDEETQNILSSATIETAVNLYDATRGEIVLNYLMLFNSVNPLRICLNRNITGDTVYFMDVIVRYEDSGSANEYYNIVNQSLDANTNSSKITLYDLNLTDSTEFQLTFTGSDFLPIENALIYVDRQYISENTFKTVELPKTDFNGQSILHLVRNDVIYNIRIIKDGAVLGNFENLVAFCDDFTIGDCNIELNAFDSVEAVFNYDEALGIIFTDPTYNGTSNKVSFNFVTSDGSSKTVLLEVSRNDIFGNRSICNSTLTSSGGTLTCDIDPNIDESTLKVEVYTDGILTFVDSVNLDSTNFGVAGYLIMFVMAISFIFMFSGSKTGVLLSLGITLAGSIGLGLVSGELIGIGASGLWLIIIIVIGIWKLNAERRS